jgi:excisionase family DNA binding protein
MNLNADQDESNSDRSQRCRSLDSGEQAESRDSDENARPMLSKELQLFSVVEVSQILGIGRSKVYELLYKGELKSVKIGGSRRIRYSDLGEYVRYLDDAS